MKTWLLALMAGALTLLTTGCMTPPPPAVTYTYINVRATADQRLILEGRPVDVATFVRRARFNRASNAVYLDVAPDSLITRTTVKELIDRLTQRGYRVSMQPGSKYEELNAYAAPQPKP